MAARGGVGVLSVYDEAPRALGRRRGNAEPVDVEHPVRGIGNSVWGIALIVIGAILLLDRFDVIFIGDFWRLWPLVIIYFGAAQLFSPRGDKRSAWLFLIGIWLLVSTLEVFGFDYGNSWPLLIMLVGVSMLLDQRFERRPASRRAADEADSPQS